MPAKSSTLCLRALRRRSVRFRSMMSLSKACVKFSTLRALTSVPGLSELMMLTRYWYGTVGDANGPL